MDPYQHLLPLFNNHLSEYITKLGERQPSELYDPGRYILGLGGKRVRPILALAGCELFGKDASLALDAALAAEVFHNFSLVHDDILDNAPLRRNKPTVHVKYGTSPAILAGDVMLVESIRILDRYPDPVYRQLARLLQTTAVEVCEGQQMDMGFETGGSISVQDYVRMITLKTAVLLGCTLKMGAICAGAQADDQEKLYEFGKHTGIAFQLLDDLLDCFPLSVSFGKQIGGDIAARKKTYLLLKASELSDAGQKKILQSQYGNDGPLSPEMISQVLGVFSELKVDKLCREEAEHHTNKAIAALSQVNCEDKHKKSLGKFATDLLHRNS